MLSKACEYAVKASIYIAKQSLDSKVSAVKEVSAAVDAPEAFTAKILQQLSRAGLMESVRGKQGGFFLPQERMKAIYIGEIIRIIDGDGIFVNCGLGLKECSETNPCPVHEEFSEIRRRIAEMSRKFSLYELALKTEEGIFRLKA